MYASYPAILWVGALAPTGRGQHLSGLKPRPTGFDASWQLRCILEAGVLKLLVEPAVLRECEEVIRRKASGSLPRLAHLLAAARVETSLPPLRQQIKSAQSYVRYIPDARVMAEAIRAKADWFVTHDKEHFLKSRLNSILPFEIGTPGDLIQKLKMVWGQAG